MTEKISIEQANPFLEIRRIINTTDDIVPLESKVEHDSYISIPELLNDNTTLSDYPSDTEDWEEKGNEKLALYLNLLTKAKEGKVFKALVESETGVGLLVSVEGLQCFMPEGQIGLEYIEDLQALVGNIIDVKLISIKIKEGETNRFLPIVSHKAIEDEKISRSVQEKLQEIKIGDIIQGTVKNITDYGVFVTLFPLIDGLIYKLDLSWNRLLEPYEIVSIGQAITVVVLDIKQGDDDANPKICLGRKQLFPSPWEGFDKNSKEGDIVSGLVYNITKQGLFITLPSGVDGFIPQSELSWFRSTNPKNFRKGQTITAKIIQIDWENESLHLSIRQMLANPWDDIETKVAVGDVIEVTITGFTNFGIFASVGKDIEGLIHRNELSWTSMIEKPKYYYTKGQRLLAKIISFDKEKRRIELSHKQTVPNPFKDFSIGQRVDASITSIGPIHTCVRLGDAIIESIRTNLIPSASMLNKGDKLECFVKEINENNRRIVLSVI